jgi:hypothetical protein
MYVPFTSYNIHLILKMEVFGQKEERNPHSNMYEFHREYGVPIQRGDLLQL